MICQFGNPEVVEALLDFGADTAAQDEDGRTALDWAKKASKLY